MNSKLKTDTVLHDVQKRSVPLRLELATGPGGSQAKFLSAPTSVCLAVPKIAAKHTPIDANSHKMMMYDFTGFILILFTAIVTPYELAFLKTATNVSEIDGLWSFNRFVDAYFIFDLFFNFIKPLRLNTEVVTYIPGDTKPSKFWKLNA